MRAPLLPVVSALAVTAVVGSIYFYLKFGNHSPALNPVNKIESIHSEQGSSPSNNRPIAETDGEPAWTKLEPAYKNYKVQIVNDGSLQADNHALELYGIKILPRSQICTYRNGERWACGQRAYIALLNILGSTTIDCRPKDANRPQLVICRLAGIDISELMLREGWGNVANGVTEKQYVDAVNAAFAHKVGMWSQQPTQKSAYQPR
jgi:endonuclease YncB( thermonuclease family)